MATKSDIKKTVSKTQYIRQEIPASKVHPTPYDCVRIKDDSLYIGGETWFVSTFERKTKLNTILPVPKNSEICDCGVEDGLLFRADTVEEN